MSLLEGIRSVEDRRKAGPTIFRKGVLMCIVFLLAIGASAALAATGGGHGEARRRDGSPLIHTG